MLSNATWPALTLVALSCAWACAAPPKSSTMPSASGATLVPLASRMTADGQVKAEWMGADPGPGVGPSSPAGLWIQEIHFSFRSEPEPLRYSFSFDSDCATFDIFSPDGRYVALSSTPSAPFHLIAVAALPAYLRHEPAAYDVVTGQRSPSDQALSIHAPGWTSNDTFELEAACCGARWHVKHRVGGTTETSPVQEAE